MDISLFVIKKEGVINICRFSTNVYNTLFFYLDYRNSQNLKKRTILGSNFGGTLEAAGAINQKMVLTNIAQDGILYLRLNYQHVFKKIHNPTLQSPISKLVGYGTSGSRYRRNLLPPKRFR